MAIYNSETNTFDGIPAEEYHRKVRVIEHGAPLGSKDEEEENNKPHYGYGLLVLIGVITLGWFFADGWKFLLFILVKGWGYLIAFGFIALGIYYSFFAPRE